MTSQTLGQISLNVDTHKSQSSLFFIESKSVYTTQSVWIATFLVNFDPYKQYVSILHQELNDISGILRFYYDSTQAKSITIEQKPTTQLHLRLGQERLHTFKLKLSELNTIIDNVHLLIGKPNNRDKRALFSFLGSILKGITGVATENDIKLINSNLRQLADSNLELTHVVEDSISVVNVTRLKLSQTIDTVNKLLNVTGNIQMELRKMSTSIMKDFGEFRNFMSHWHQISLYFDTLQDSIATAFDRFQHLYDQISEVLHHQVSPNVITPLDLHAILRQIEKTINPSLSMPFDINSDIISYYSHIKSSLVLHDTGIMVTLAVPLLSEHYKFTLFRILNVPVPSQKDGISLIYDIPFQYLALAEDRTQFVILDSQTFETCSNAYNKFCNFKLPIMNTADVTDTCVFAMMFRRDSSKCHIKMYHDNIWYPKGDMLGNGSWVISTTADIVFNILCLDGNRNTQYLKAPIGLIHLQLGCKAISADMLLPYRYVHQHSVHVANINFMARPNMSVYDLPYTYTDKPVVYQLPNQVKLLSDDGQMSIQRLLNRLHNHARGVYRFKKNIPKEGLSWQTILIIILSLLIGLLLLMAFVEYKFKLIRHLCGKTGHPQVVVPPEDGQTDPQPEDSLLSGTLPQNEAAESKELSVASPALTVPLSSDCVDSSSAEVVTSAPTISIYPKLPHSY